MSMLDKLLSQLNRLWKARQEEVHSRWHRTLPFGEYVVDRWEKARILGFGKHTSIYDSAVVIGNVTVGKHTWIGPNTLLDGSGGLEIGDYCSVSAGVQIYTHDSIRWAITGGHAEYEHHATMIGSNCYIGPNTVIAKGVKIGNRCVIGAQSLVLRDIPDGSKAAGIPCRIVGDVDEYRPDMT